MKKIVAVHLLNDRSGSPLVFKEALEILKHQYAITLYTSTVNGEGFLSNIHGIEKKEIGYKWSNRKFITLYRFLSTQIKLFIALIKTLNKEDVVYINTLLPFGAALAAIIKKATVVYHVHEVTIHPQPLKKLLSRVANNCAGKIIFVSRYVAGEFEFTKPVTSVIHNVLPQDFLKRSQAIEKLNTNFPFTVLMLCSLKAYKGIYEFVALAKKMDRIKFVLVLNASREEVEVFRKEIKPSANCLLYSSKQNTIPFYKQAHVVVNLSKQNEWVETFGMTILEAMKCGRPVIVPTVGGVCELVEPGKEGFRINSDDEKQLSDAINFLSSDIKTYMRMSEAAVQKAKQFEPENFKNQLLEVFNITSNSSSKQKKLIA